MGMPRRKKEPKKHVEVITEKAEPGMYKMLGGLVAEHHKGLEKARIVLAWALGLKADADGIVTLGRMQRPSEVNRKLHKCDLIVLINKTAWVQPEFSKEMKAALLDHELCHAQLSEDRLGNAKRDGDGGLCYRMRKHDLTEFACVVDRHGIYTTALARFARSLSKAKDLTMPLLAESGSRA